jgi:hypothetical protein
MGPQSEKRVSLAEFEHSCRIVVIESESGQAIGGRGRPPKS